MFDIFYIENKPMTFPQARQVKDIEEAREKSTTRFCWILNGYNAYISDNWDMLWEPKPWEAKQIHVWPSQHQESGGTYLISKDHNGDINYHDSIIYRVLFPKIVYLEHGDGRAFCAMGAAYRIYKSKFINDYLGTLKRIVNRYKDQEYLWVISSVCDYTRFDFTWHPSEWQNEMLHVFPSNEQKFGDTFYINVKNFLDQIDNLELLEWYDTICFRDETTVVRHSMPTVLHDCDTQVDAVKEHIFKSIADGLFTSPLALFTKYSVFESALGPTINLWRPETRTITPLSKSGDPCIIPRDALPYIKNELYDYPYIDKTDTSRYNDDQLDIVFLSHSEECAQANYDHLDKITHYNIRWVKNVTGRLAAYRECANQVQTDWFFIVCAKLKVDKNFDWGWQPDRLQKAKHYIFQAYNPLTDDTYGHMAMIAFNKNLVLEHDGEGLDFSLHQAHEVVPILSGDAVYGPGDWDLWRTAFREVLKLRATMNIEADLRQSKWIHSKDEWTAKGAHDALYYYDLVNGDMEKLKLSYEWDWLAKYYYMKYIPIKTTF